MAAVAAAVPAAAQPVAAAPVIAGQPNPAVLWAKAPLRGAVLNVGPNLQAAVLTWPADGVVQAPGDDAPHIEPKFFTKFESKQFGVVAYVPSFGDAYTRQQFDTARAQILEVLKPHKPVEASMGVVRSSVFADGFPAASAAAVDDGLPVVVAYIGCERRLRQETTSLERAQILLDGVGAGGSNAPLHTFCGDGALVTERTREGHG